MWRQIVGAWLGAALALAGALTADEAMGPELVISSSDGNDRAAQAAYDPTHDEFVVVWQEDDAGSSTYYRILARRFDRNGLPLAGTVVVGPGGDFHDRIYPSIAYDPTTDGFLVVYSYDYWDDGSDWDLRGRFFDWNLGGGGPELTLADSVDDEYLAQVAFSAASQVFLVVWERELAGLGRIEGALVASGAAGSPFAVAAHPTESRVAPRVAHDATADTFLVTSYNYLDIFATRVEASGALGPEVTVAAWPDEEVGPDVASCGNDQFAVVWRSDTDGGDDDIYVRFLHGDGTIASTPIVIDGSPDGEVAPFVACLRQSGEYLIVYYRYAVTSSLRGLRISTSQVLRPGYDILPDSGGAGGFWGVTGGGAGWIAVWAAYDPTTGSDIHGRVTWSLFADDFEWGNPSQWSSVVP